MSEKEYWRDYYERNKEKCKMYMRRYAAKNRKYLSEKHKEYYLANKDRIEARRKACRLKKAISALTEQIGELRDRVSVLKEDAEFFMDVVSNGYKKEVKEVKEARKELKYQLTKLEKKEKKLRSYEKELAELEAGRERKE